MLKYSLIILFILCNFFHIAHAQEYKAMIRSGNHTVKDIQIEAEKYFKENEKNRHSGYKQYKRWEYNALRLMNQQGYLPKKADIFKEIEALNAKENNRFLNRAVSANDNWQELGPKEWNVLASGNPGIGRVTSVAIEEANQQHIVITAPSGGIWKTTDGGTHWQPLADQFESMGMYSVAMDQKDSKIYYCGGIYGRLYKTTDGGKSWLKSNLEYQGDINKILIHPNNNQIVYISSLGYGIFKSKDGGKSWQKVLDEYTSYDIEFKPGDPSVVYASGEFFYKSTNNGLSFKKIGGFQNGTKMMGVSKADPSRVYVLETKDGSFGALYISKNSGKSFSKIEHGSIKDLLGRDSEGGFGGGQAPRDMDIAVSPSNADEVHVAGIITWRSLDAGKNFDCSSVWVHEYSVSQNLGYCHADIDILEFAGNNLFVGSDGGIFVSTNSSKKISKHYFKDLSHGLGIRECYKLGVSQTDPVMITSGSQDNGTSFMDKKGKWYDWLGGDGMETFFHPVNPNIIYGTCQNGALFKTTDGGKTYIGLYAPNDKPGLWVTAFEKDPIDHNTIYVAYNKINKSTNGGDTWNAISQDFKFNVELFKIAPSNNKTIYAVRADRLYRTTTGGGVWNLMHDDEGSINAIAIHPTNPNKIAMAVTSSSKVIISDDGGKTWKPYGQGLPKSFSSMCLEWYNNAKAGLFLGMNVGIYYRDNSKEKWVQYSKNLPNIMINELEINYADKKIYAATYGRGIWRSKLPDQNNSVMQDKESSIRIFPSVVQNQITIASDNLFNANIKIYDINGGEIYHSSNVDILDNSIDVSDYKAGVYFIRVSAANFVTTKKFIKI